MGVSAHLLGSYMFSATTGAHSGEVVRPCDFVQVVGLVPQGRRIFYRLLLLLLLGGDWPPLFPYHREIRL